MNQNCNTSKKEKEGFKLFKNVSTTIFQVQYDFFENFKKVSQNDVYDLEYTDLIWENYFPFFRCFPKISFWYLSEWLLLLFKLNDNNKYWNNKWIIKIHISKTKNFLNEKTYNILWIFFWNHPKLLNDQKPLHIYIPKKKFTCFCVWKQFIICPFISFHTSHNHRLWQHGCET